MNRAVLVIGTLLVVLACCTASRSTSEAMQNTRATLKGELPINPLEWRVITCGANQHEFTMSILFGNDTAIQYSRRRREGDYPPGSMLALVTWAQQEDSRWFGARMPAEAKSVETVEVGRSEGGHPLYSYQEYEGSPLRKIAGMEDRAKERVAYLLSQRAAVMP